MNIEDVHICRSEIFLDVHVKMVFVLTSTVWFYVVTIYNFKEILCTYVVRNMRQPTYSKCMWLAYCGLHLLARELEVLNC